VREGKKLPIPTHGSTHHQRRSQSAAGSAAAAAAVAAAAASVPAPMDGYAVPGNRHGHDAAADDDVPAALHALCSPSLPPAAAPSLPPPPPQTARRFPRRLLRRDQDHLARRPPPLDGRELPPQLLCSHRRGTIQFIHFFSITWFLHLHFFVSHTSE